MIKNSFLQKIRKEIPANVRTRVRKYADSVIKSGKKNEPTRCTNCKCQDLEEWLDCHDGKK